MFNTKLQNYPISEYQADDVKCVEGDRMGCGLIFLEDVDAFTEQTVIVYFTKDGDIIHHKCVKQPEGGFYPTVGFCTKGMYEFKYIYHYVIAYNVDV